MTERYSNNAEQRITLSINSYKYLLNKKIQLRIGADFVDWLNSSFNPNNIETLKTDTRKISLNLGVLFTTDVLFN